MEKIEKSEKKKSFLNYINVFRGLAILLIIMGHTMQFAPSNSLIHIINCEIICGGTALFIFISGFLFEHLSKKFEYKNYLSKKWTNVILPYLITSIPGLLFCFLMPVQYKNPFDGLNYFIQTPLLLSIGRVHNVPSWFILMIIIFFIFSSLLLKLEKKNILFKFLPLLFLLTIFIPRPSAEFQDTIGLDYFAKYLIYVKYILFNFIHFASLYVFGMFCSKNKDTIIDKFYDRRFLLWVLMIVLSVLDIFLQYKYSYSNFTLSKTILTMLVLGYLKHYDNFFVSHDKLNKTLDLIAKYSFGLFFVHWYLFFIYNQIFKLENVIPLEVFSLSAILQVFFVVLMRFLFVALASMLTLFVLKKILVKIKPDINTRMFLGI